MDSYELTPDQKAKFEACETPDEILKLAQDEGIELTDDQMEDVAGGVEWKSSCFMDCNSN